MARLSLCVVLEAGRCGADAVVVSKAARTSLRRESLSYALNFMILRTTVADIAEYGRPCPLSRPAVVVLTEGVDLIGGYTSCGDTEVRYAMGLTCKVAAEVVHVR